jgi:hypothetical protein
MVLIERALSMRSVELIAVAIFTNSKPYRVVKKRMITTSFASLETLEQP